MHGAKMFSFILALGVAAHVTSGQLPTLGCKKVLDLVLVVDGSDSISDPDFEKIKISIASLVNRLDIENDQIWFGLVLYSSDITEVLRLQHDKQKILQKISLLKHARMGTNTALGIQTMDAILNSGRQNVPKMGVVITDGISLNTSETHDAAVNAINSGVSMYSAGIGSLIHMGELQGIATGLSYVLNFTDFDNLSLDFVDSAAAEICPNLCVNCTVENGAAYNSHPTDCDKFVQCHSNHFGHLIGEIQKCAFATYWNMHKLTCVPYDKITCKNDKCAGLPDLTAFRAESNCRGYWECVDGQAVPKCCPLGYRYGEAKGCIEDKDEECLDRCFNDKIKKQECDKSEIAGNPHVYKQYVAGHGHYTMPCAPGTVFVQDKCTCETGKTVIVKERKCRPEIYLPFTANTYDMSGNGFYVGNENVFVRNGVAKFYGNGRLIIPRFANLEHSKAVVIKIKYTSSATGSTVARAIVSNCDCGNRPSIMISEDSSNIYFGVGTSSKLFEFSSIPREQTSSGPVTSQELTYIFENGVLSGTNGVNETRIDVPGTLRNVQCGLHIGDADDLDNFVGEIDEISVYLCNPDKP